MTYLLYGDFGSGSCIVELALAEIGADYEARHVDLDADAQRDAGYSGINPQRKIPALVMPDGDTLTESVAIVLTLDEHHPEAGLLPPPRSPERAQALRWLLFVATELYPIVEICDYPERFAPDPDSNARVTREIARGIWRRRWLVVEDNIVGDPYCLSGGFCLTDIYIAVVSRWTQQNEWRRSQLSKIENLTRTVAARPACAPVWRRHFPG
jgi:glutathione S-transferase